MDNNLETLKECFKQKYKDDKNVLSAVAVENPSPYSPLIDGYDLMVLIVTKKSIPEEWGTISHYIKDHYHIQERWIDVEGIKKWILNGENRNIIQWILQGEIILDATTYLEDLRHRLLEFPEPLRNQRLLSEFSHFLKRYLQTKQYLKAGHTLDAYSNVLEALHHWARIAIIEHGAHPEMMVWKQVRQINPGVYKMYEELTQSEETLEQRIQLVLLGCEFSVISKMQHCCRRIIEALSESPTPMSVDELNRLDDFRGLQLEMSLILKKMVSRSLIKEVTVSTDKEFSVLELKYTV